jgi:hypothetical protein
LRQESLATRSVIHRVSRYTQKPLKSKAGTQGEERQEGMMGTFYFSSYLSPAMPRFIKTSFGYQSRGSDFQLIKIFDHGLYLLSKIDF